MFKKPAQHLRGLAAAALGLALGAAPAAAEITLDVLYTTPGTFNTLQQDLAKRFTEKQPDIKIKFRNPAASYEEAAQQILRDQLTGRLPDVAFNGINQIGLFVDRGLGSPLDDLIAADGGVAKLGYYPTLAALGRWKDRSYGFTFAVSTPVLYVNADLIEKAGGKVEDLPRTWPELIAFGKRVEAAAGSGRTGLYFQWEQTGNWLVQSLITSRGGRVLKADGCRVAFDDDRGMWALKTLEAFGKSGMPNLALGQARQSFVAGNVAILVDSTSYVAAAQRQIGDRFAFRTVAFPLAAPEGLLPAGGNVAMVFTKDEPRRKAAWEYIKFVTGPIGQTQMVNLTGYMPGNELAVKDPELLGQFYQKNPNHQTSIDQLPVLTEWVSFPGENSLKVIEVIKAHTEALVTGRATAEQTMPALVADVPKLLPACGGR
ncbi:MAG: ABC transporter substrate-binding protein [Bosea sp.]|uniref:ABC transporter substrate-binding protein n=1 Tax=Bosea sp. (in: a-proteobacteria) TaxID=1871050 RepID=UPI002395E846|nr:ABC transporter substrate-binding protein [Bosea sp. (in: a-proteobacteria)]MCP4736995.1 ABC transporter substrate-binding protein [Bosea sp. (in: a-proteobacteria)]